MVIPTIILLGGGTFCVYKAYRFGEAVISSPMTAISATGQQIDQATVVGQLANLIKETGAREQANAEIFERCIERVSAATPMEQGLSISGFESVMEKTQTQCLKLILESSTTTSHHSGTTDLQSTIPQKALEIIQENAKNFGACVLSKTTTEQELSLPRFISEEIKVECLNSILNPSSTSDSSLTTNLVQPVSQNALEIMKQIPVVTAAVLQSGFRLAGHVLDSATPSLHIESILSPITTNGTQTIEACRSLAENCWNRFSAEICSDLIQTCTDATKERFSKITAEETAQITAELIIQGCRSTLFGDDYCEKAGSDLPKAVQEATTAFELSKYEHVNFKLIAQMITASIIIGAVVLTAAGICWCRRKPAFTLPIVREIPETTIAIFEESNEDAVVDPPKPPEDLDETSKSTVDLNEEIDLDEVKEIDDILQNLEPNKTFWNKVCDWFGGFSLNFNLFDLFFSLFKRDRKETSGEDTV